MTARNVVRVLSVLACAALMIVPAFAGDDEGLGKGNNGQGVCTLEGAWYGVTPYWGLTWTAIYNSDSHWTGSMSLSFIGGDPSLGGAYPDVVSLSETIGTWVRTGRRSFDYTMVHYGLSAAGLDPEDPEETQDPILPIFLLKNTGSFIVTGDCDQLEITNTTLEFYDPMQDPFAEDGYLCYPDGSPSFARRIPVQAPCEPTPQ